MAAANNKISEMDLKAEVLKAVENLPRTGILAQDGYSGKLYLDIDDQFIFQALKVLEEFGYISPPFFVFPPVPLGAHITIVDEREAVDYELVGEREGKKEIAGLGKIVDFKVVDVRPYHLLDGLDAELYHPSYRGSTIYERYEILVESPELEAIRNSLTGLPPKDHGVFINIGVWTSSTYFN